MNVKTAVAAVIAIAGVVLAGRALLRTGPPRPSVSDGVAARTREAPAPIGSQYRLLSDPEEVRRVVDEAVGVAVRGSGLPQRVQAAGPADLQKVVVERFQALLATDIDRDLAALVRRGATVDPGSFDDEGRARLMRWMGAYNDAKPDFGKLSIRMVCNRGVWISDEEMMMGYGRTMTEIQGPMAPPVPEKPSETLSDVVEVRVPMLVDAPGAGEHEVIAAYMLIWNPRSSSWVPFRSMIYHTHSHVPYVAPFL